jgi:hypothetical protein
MEADVSAPLTQSTPKRYANSNKIKTIFAVNEFEIEAS